MGLAFFDMDRTVLRIDTGMSWMRFLRRRGEISRADMARAAGWSLLYKAALLDLRALAERLCADLAGDLERDMREKARTWYEIDVCHQVAPPALETIEDHRRRGDEVVLLTGATQYAAHAVAAGIGIEHVLCTRLEVASGCFTGRLETLCFGEHKVPLAEDFAAARRESLAGATFYSDSYNDLPMLRRVGTAVAVNPDARLRAHAVRARWRIERWDR
jgi:HAD superfamily hydrolase (TIGR01490 family)